MLPDYQTLIHHSEQPKRDAVCAADFDIVECQITVSHIFNLIKTFAFASNFERVFHINKKIARRRIPDIVVLRELIHKKTSPAKFQCRFDKIFGNTIFFVKKCLETFFYDSIALQMVKMHY